IRPKLNESTFTSASRSFIKAKLLDCCRTHSLCRTATSGDFLPTRLLDTRASPASVVKLVSGLEESTEYATLSHCWGKAQIIQLKQALESTFTDNGIPVDSLPPTFQQAVIVTRCLGIRYLWIDSLCIMQDSKEDWETESALMASVYGHAIVNIAASSSCDSRGGLFYQRDPLTVQPFAARGRNIPGLADGWYLWKNDNRWSALSSQPLNRRGWVLQERLLSARTIHYSDTEVIMHCLEDMSSESIPLQVNIGTASRLAVPIMQVGDYTDMRVAMAAVQRDGLTDENKVKLYREWKRVLAHYTQCGLTNGGDKLIAIAGIVDRLEALTGDRCYAGLWRSEMPACLVWLPEWGADDLDGQLMRQYSMPEEPTEWRSPSWSWASRDGAVEYPR
ncbi:heterokaryon incompatibility protein-domain-containing protein, partial [Podospora conica]